MIPGPTLVRKCSACAGLITQRSIISGNTFGARYWSDGKCEAPMLPDRPSLVRCPHCRAMVWIDEQEQVGELEPWDSPGDTSGPFKDARPYSTPTLRDYLAVLKQGVSDPDKQHYLRLRAWWSGNDRRRVPGKTLPLTDPEVANLVAFASLLADTDENDRIMKAEIMRELALFAEAQSLLSGTFSEELSDAAATIRALVEQRITALQEFKAE
jgi:hypothetical protein